jgi:hypothetical protein
LSAQSLDLSLNYDKLLT